MEKTVIINLKTTGFDKTIKTLAEASEALTELEQKQAELQAQLAKAESGSDAYKALEESINQTAQSINDLKTAISGVDASAGIQKVADSMVDVNVETVKTTNAVIDLDSALQNTGDNTGIVKSFKSIRDLKAELAEAEDLLEQIDPASDTFLELNVKVERTQKQLEAMRLQGEAVALGFKGIGQAGNTVEGLEVKIQQLNASFSLASSELEKAQIQKDIEAIRVEVQQLEAQAKQGIFPPGSIGALSAEAEKLQIALSRIPVGTKEYGQIKQRLDDVNIQLNFVSQTAEEQRQSLRDLGTSFVSTFGTASGLLASFAGDSKEAQESILVLQQTLAAVDLIQQASETLRLARQAKKVAILQAETSATIANTGATLANVGAQNAVSAGLDGASKAGKGFSGTLQVIGNVIKANPLLAIASILVVIGTAVVALSRKFKPLGDAVNFVSDTFSGVGRAIKEAGNRAETFGDVLKNVLTLAIKGALAPLTLLNEALVAIGVNTGIDSVTKDIKELKDSAEEAGNALAEGFQKGFDKARALRKLDAQQALNDATDSAAAVAEAELGSARATSSARRGIRLQEAQEDRNLATERIKLTRELTDAQLKILKSGNAEQIRQIKGVVDARGEVDEQLKDQLDAIAQAEQTINTERNEAFQEYIQDQIGLIDSRLQAELSALETVNSFGNREIALRKERDAELAKLDLQRRAGEFKTAEEFNTRKAKIEQDSINKTNDLKREEAQFALDLAQQTTEAQIKETERRAELLSQVGQLTFEQERENANKITDARVEALQRERATLNQRINNVEQVAKEEARIDSEIKDLQAENQIKLTDITIREIEKRADVALKAIDIQETRLEQARLQAEGVDLVNQQSVEQGQRALERLRDIAVDLQDSATLYRQEQQLINQKYSDQTAQLERNYQIEIDSIAVEQARLGVEFQKLNAQKEQGVISQSQYEQELKSLEAQESLLKTREDLAKIKLDNELTITVNAKQDEIKKSAEDIANSFVNSFNNPLETGITKGFADVFSKALSKSSDTAVAENADKLGKIFAEKFTSQLSQIGTQFVALLDSLDQARIQNIEKQVDQIDEQITTIDESLGLLREDYQQSLADAKNLETQLNDSRASNFETLQAQLANEEDRRSKLQNSIRNQEAERRNFEQQRLALEERKRQVEIASARRQKVIAVGQAIANTALGITSAIATVPKVDFGISTAALIALYTTLGALQVATILAQPDPAEKGGMLGDDGRLIKMAGGGKVAGNSHAQGGVRGTGKFNNVEVEGGEYIVNKRAVQRNQTAIETINTYGHATDFDVQPKKMTYGGLLNANVSPGLSNDTVQTVRQSSGNVSPSQLLENIEIRPTVAVTQIEEQQQKLRVIQNNATL